MKITVLNVLFTEFDWMLRHRDFHRLLRHRDQPQPRIAPSNPDLEEQQPEDSTSEHSNSTRYSDIFRNPLTCIREHEPDYVNASAISNMNNHEITIIALVVLTVVLGLVSIAIAAMFFTCVK